MIDFIITHKGLLAMAGTLVCFYLVFMCMFIDSSRRNRQDKQALMDRG